MSGKNGEGKGKFGQSLFLRFWCLTAPEKASEKTQQGRGDFDMYTRTTKLYARKMGEERENAPPGGVDSNSKCNKIWNCRPVLHEVESASWREQASGTKNFAAIGFRF